MNGEHRLSSAKNHRICSTKQSNNHPQRHSCARPSPSLSFSCAHDIDASVRWREIWWGTVIIAWLSTFNHAMMTVPHHISQTSELASGVILRRNRTLLSGYFIGPKGYAEQRIKKQEFGIAVQITKSGREDQNNHTRLTFARLSTNLELRSSVPEAGDSSKSQPN